VPQDEAAPASDFHSTPLQWSVCCGGCELPSFASLTSRGQAERGRARGKWIRGNFLALHFQICMAFFKKTLISEQIIFLHAVASLTWENHNPISCPQAPCSAHTHCNTAHRTRTHTATALEASTRSKPSQNQSRISRRERLFLPACISFYFGIQPPPGFQHGGASSALHLWWWRLGDRILGSPRSRFYSG
jgi:hypothetical protein